MRILDFLNKSKNRDEKMKKASNEIAAKLVPLSLILVLVTVIIKLIMFEFTIPLVIIEAIILFYVVILAFKWIQMGLPFKKSMDEALYNMQITYLSSFTYATLYTYIFLEFILFLFVDMPIVQYVFYFLVWFPVMMIYSIISIKKELHIGGSKKKKKINIKKFKKSVFVSSLLYGLFMAAYMPTIGGSFTWISLLWTPVYAITWGLPFYFIMNHLVKISEKKANKIINE